MDNLLKLKMSYEHIIKNRYRSASHRTFQHYLDTKDCKALYADYLYYYNRWIDGLRV